MVRRAGGGVDTADCLISPDLIGSSYVRFSKRLDMMTKGEIATEARLDCIRAAMRGEPPDRQSQGQPDPATAGAHLQPPPPEGLDVRGRG